MKENKTDVASSNCLTKEGYVGLFKSVVVQHVETQFKRLIFRYFRRFEVDDPSIVFLSLSAIILFLSSSYVLLPGYLTSDSF